MQDQPETQHQWLPVAVVIGILGVLLALGALQTNVGASPAPQATPTPEMPELGTPTPAPGTATPEPPGATPEPPRATPEPPSATPAPPVDRRSQRPTPVEPTPIPYADATETTGAWLRTELTTLLLAHVSLTGSAAAIALGDGDDEAADNAQAAMEQHSERLAVIVRSFYGSAAADQFQALWDQHVELLMDYAEAVADDDDISDEAMEQAEQIATDLAALLSGANPLLDQDVLRQHILEHERLLMAYIDRLADDDVNAYLALEPAAFQARAIADMLASATVRQFPEQVAVMDAMHATAGAWDRRDVEALLDRFTDAGLMNEFDAGRDELRQALPQFIGDPPARVLEVSNVQVNGDRATAEVEIAFGIAIDRFRQQFVRDDDMWRLDVSEMLEPTLGPEVSSLPVEMDEFSFSFDEDDAAEGVAAFRAINVGQQEHELLLVRLAEDLPPIEEVVESSPDEPPEGVEIIGGTFAGPGEERTLKLAYPLQPGRYAMVCFLPDTSSPEQTPHALLGMVAEFEVE